MLMNRTEEQWLSRLESNRRQLESLRRSVQGAGGVDAIDGPATGPASHDDMARSLVDSFSTEAMLRLLATNQEQVEHAVDRLRRGQYGHCEDCGRPIPEERLRFRPEATRCVGCQSRVEDLAPMT